MKRFRFQFMFPSQITLDDQSVFITERLEKLIGIVFQKIGGKKFKGKSLLGTTYNHLQPLILSNENMV